MAGLSGTSGVRREAGLAAMALAGVAVASIAGQIATLPNLAPWYAGLAKPSFTPPNWVFGPAWTALYLLMALAAWRVFRTRTGSHGSALARNRRRGVQLFFLLLLLNAAWPWLFFAAHAPLPALAELLVQLVAVFATLSTFWRVDPFAGLCLMPLFGWVAFAGLLNFEIWRLNG